MTVSAKEFAIKAHGAQRYGNGPYSNHLSAVVEVLSDFGYEGDFLAAGWLHDVLEDTKVTRVDLRITFGFKIASLVEACTGVGATRASRNQSIYKKIALFPEAAIVKVADRIANIEASTLGSNHFARYSVERQEFDEHVVKYAPYAMKRRLDKEMDLRRSVMFA